MRILGAIVLFMAMPVLAPAEVQMRTQTENVNEEFDEFRGFIEKLGGEERQANSRNVYASAARINVPGKLTGHWKEGLENPYKKNVALDTLSEIGKAAALSVGTINQAANAAMLRERAAELESTGDPQYQQVAANYRAEANAIDAGDLDAAKGEADKNYMIPRDDTSGYTPSGNDLNYKQRSNKIAGKVVGTIVGVVAAAALTYFTGGSAAAYAPMAGAAVGGLVEYGVDSAQGDDDNSAEDALNDKLDSSLEGMGDQAANDISDSLANKFSKDKNVGGKDNAEKDKFNNEMDKFGIDTPFKDDKRTYDTGSGNVDGKVLR